MQIGARRQRRPLGHRRGAVSAATRNSVPTGRRGKARPGSKPGLSRTPRPAASRVLLVVERERRPVHPAGRCRIGRCRCRCRGRCRCRCHERPAVLAAGPAGLGRCPSGHCRCPTGLGRCRIGCTPVGHTPADRHLGSAARADRPERSGHLARSPTPHRGRQRCWGHRAR